MTTGGASRVTAKGKFDGFAIFKAKFLGDIQMSSNYYLTFATKFAQDILLLGNKVG